MKAERKYVPLAMYRRLQESRDRLRNDAAKQLAKARLREERLRELMAALDAMIREPGDETWRELMAVRKQAKTILVKGRR